MTNSRALQSWTFKWLIRTTIWTLAFLTPFQSCRAVGQQTPTLKATPQSSQAPKCRVVPTPIPPNLPPCKKPVSNPQPLKSGGHTVTLSWNANPPSTKPSMQAVGYCLYRSKTQFAASKNPLCSDCEQINAVAFPGTTCLDDRVEDGTTYFYIVTAANSKGDISKSSNEATAQVKSTEPANPASVPTNPATQPK
jgi:hypothetical protein